MFAPCTLFTQPDRVLRTVSLDLVRVDLTDAAVTLLVDMGVDRCMDNPRNLTTLRVAGSSVGLETLNALSTSVAFPGFKFVSTFDVTPGHRMVPTPVSSALLRHLWLYNPFVHPTAIQWDAAV